MKQPQDLYSKRQCGRMNQVMGLSMVRVTKGIAKIIFALYKLTVNDSWLRIDLHQLTGLEKGDKNAQ